MGLGHAGGITQTLDRRWPWVTPMHDTMTLATSLLVAMCSRSRKLGPGADGGVKAVVRWSTTSGCQQSGLTVAEPRHWLVVEGGEKDDGRWWDLKGVKGTETGW